jgi:hypothetical protein
MANTPFPPGGDYYYMQNILAIPVFLFEAFAYLSIFQLIKAGI